MAIDEFKDFHVTEDVAYDGVKAYSMLTVLSTVTVASEGDKEIEVGCTEFTFTEQVTGLPI